MIGKMVLEMRSKNCFIFYVLVLNLPYKLQMTFNFSTLLVCYICGYNEWGII